MIRETEEYLRTTRLKQTRRYNLADAAFFRFTQMLEYKGKWYGTAVKKVDKYFPSTRLCSYCQTKYPENLLSNIKEWICLNPNCPTHQNLPGIPFKIPRDINASINLLREGLRLSPNINIQSVYPAYTQEYRVSKDLYNNEMKEAKERLQIEKQLIKVDTMKKDAESFINKLNTPKFGK